MPCPCCPPPCSGSCDEENPCPEGCYCCDGQCQGEPCGGTCCGSGGNCIEGGPGPACIPTGDPGDDGCYCDSQCYSVCFDCCGEDAIDCCTPKPAIDSLWDDSGGPGAQAIHLPLLEDGLREYDIDLNEAWHAAMQSGTVIEGHYHTDGFSRISLILCLQGMESGATPWVAQQSHRARVVQAATEIRRAAQ